jgi:phosphatidylinositol-3-phosphatase
MLRIRCRLIAAIALLLVLASCGGIATPQQGAPTPPSVVTPQGTPTQAGTALRHIFYIMMENHSASEILGNTSDAPYLNQLANNYGVALHYFGVTHPSLPNYLAAISGDFQGIWDDCAAGAAVTCEPEAFGSSLTRDQATSASNRPHMFSGQTMVDQLETHHLTWKAYMQSMPSTSYTSGSTALYAQKHNPFVYFMTIRNNPTGMQRIVPLTQFDLDMKSGNVANFVWITPDLCSDMHGVSPGTAQALGIPACANDDGIIARGDNFIHTIVPEIMSSPAWNEGSAIVIAWDESDSSSEGCCKSPTGVEGVTLGGGNVPLIVIASKGPRHIVIRDRSFNHYSLLATIEQMWGLGCLGNTCGLGNPDLLTRLFA